MAWGTFPYSYTSPYIHSWIFESLRIIIFWVWVLTHPTCPYMTHPTPPHPYMTHPTLPHPFMTHPTHPYMTHPTPPDPSWPIHPTPSWPTPPLYDTPHPFMTQPPHPTPPLHDPATPPHPTPGTFLGTKEPFFMGCFTMSPFGRQQFQSAQTEWHIGSSASADKRIRMLVKPDNPGKIVTIDGQAFGSQT